MTDTYSKARMNVAKFEVECETYTNNLCLAVSELILKVSKIGAQELTIYPVSGITATTDDDVYHSVRYDNVEGYEHSKVRTAIRMLIKWLEHDGFDVKKCDSNFIVSWGDDNEY